MKTSIETDIRLDTLKQLVPELVKAIGLSCEVILHDVRNLDSSCIAISGDVTGRKIGAPMTDLGLRMLRKGDSTSNLINYSSTSSNGKLLRSSTLVIRNRKGTPIALMCINFDLSTLSILRDVIKSTFPVDFPTIDDVDASSEETFPSDVQELLKSTVSEVLSSLDKPISIMNKQDKLRVVELLDGMGVFAIKKAHYYVASVLNTSRYTIYNYLNEIRHRNL